MSGTVPYGCEELAYHGPRVLVLSLIFAEGKTLLMKRGVPPYVGTWAPPGGFVEANESLEAAAIRETAEEVGVVLPDEALIPHAMVSLPRLNQVYCVFLALLNGVQTPRASAPEALEARWFTLEEYPHETMWDPAAAFDIARAFRQVETGRFYFYQRTGESMRRFGPFAADGGTRR